MTLFLLFNFLIGFCYSQPPSLDISKKYNPVGIVEKVLKGKGVEISNVIYRGSSRAIGTFTAVNSNLGLTSGLILSTGDVYGAKGPNKYNNEATLDAAALSTNLNTSGFSLLGANSMDAAVLEFDFIPQGDTIEFQYVFASEEYPEYVPAEYNYNDIFGFFISGPGISGVKNIALLPTNEAVTIKNVNNTKNTKYYINNDNGLSVEYDGFTTVLTAVAIVQCGKKYHLTLAIADVNDRLYDSAVFLRAKSLSVRNLYDIGMTFSNYYDVEDSTLMLENCTSGKVVINRPIEQINRNTTIDILINGSVIENKDYSSTIPKSIKIPAGSSSVSFSFDALYDKETDSLDSIILTYNSTDFCPITMKYYIKNVDPLNVIMPNDTIYCKGKSIFIKPEITGGYPNYSLVWSTGSFSDSIEVLPSTSTNYSVTVNDDCFKKPVTITNSVIIPKYIPIEINTIPDIVEVCPYLPTFIPIKPQNGGGGYTYEWFKNGVVFSSEKLDTILPDRTSNFRVKITDRCGDTISTNFNYIITSPPLRTRIIGDSLMCYSDSTLIKVLATGGYGNYTYRWSTSNSNTDSTYANSLNSEWYYSYVGDDCKTFEIKDSIYVKVLRPKVNFELNGYPIVYNPISLINKSENASKFIWKINNIFYSDSKDTIAYFLDSAVYSIQLHIEDFFGCSNDTTISFQIFHTPSIYVPNAFTPNGNLYNNVFYPVLTSIKEFNLQIFNRWGELVFSTSDFRHSYWDGTYKGNLCPNDVYIYKLKTLSVTDEKKESVGHVTLIR